MKWEEKIKKFYEEAAEEFSQTRQRWWDGFYFIKKYLKDKYFFLDFGCGNGRLIEYLQKEKKDDFEYWGVDISSKLIDIAQKKYPQYNFSLIDDSDDLNLNHKFEIIFAIAVFHHFSPKKTKRKLVAWKKNLMKDNSLVIASVWYLWNRKYLKFLLKNLIKGNFNCWGEIPFKKSERKFWRPCYFWTRGRLERIFKKAGFVILESGYIVDKRRKRRNIFIVANIKEKGEENGKREKTGEIILL